MKRVFLIIVAIGAFFAPSYAMWMLIPIEDLVQDSDLIIVGTLSGLSEQTQNGIDYAQGTILVDEVIWGSANAGDSLTLKWQNHSGVVCPRVEHRYSQGKGIWLLTVEPDKTVRANYPGRFVGLSERPNVERLLVKNKVSLRIAKFAVEEDEPAYVSVVFRNPTQSPIKFPGVEYNDGRLVVGPGIALTFYDDRIGEERTKLTPLPNRVLSSQNVPPILVGPQQEFRLTVDIKTLFKVEEGRTYAVRIKVKGHRRANDIGFYSGPLTSLTGEDTMQNNKTLPPPTPGSKSALLLSSILVFAGTCFLAYRHHRRT